MITIQYNCGGFGNQMFQYCFARLLAEKNNICLSTDFSYSNVVTPTEHTVYPESSKRGCRHINDDVYNQWRTLHGSTIPVISPEYDYTVAGYFQDALLFNNNIDIIRSFFVLPKVCQDTDNTLVRVRLGDFIHDCHNSEIIHYKWYQEAISTMPGRKDILVCGYKARSSLSTGAHEDLYIDKIKSAACTLIRTGSNLRSDFELSRSYKNIICSNSTFSWWSTFLSDSDNIVTFKDFGSFGPGIKKSHGVHVHELCNIRNISQPKTGDFLDITKI